VVVPYPVIPGATDGHRVSEIKAHRLRKVTNRRSQNEHLTMVDFSSELFGLSTIWLGTEFYAKCTNHWPAAQKRYTFKARGT
jgi:hypothetical protein